MNVELSMLELCIWLSRMCDIGATVVRVAGGRVSAAMSTLLVLAAVGNRGEKGVIVVVHHSGMFVEPTYSFPFCSWWW